MSALEADVLVACGFESHLSHQISGGTATTVVLRQTVNLLRKVNIVGSTPTPFTKFKIRAGSLRGKTTGYYDIVDVIGIEANPVH